MNLKLTDCIATTDGVWARQHGNSPQAALLLSTIEVAVPFAIMDLESAGGPTASDWGWARGWATTLGAKGDMLLYRGGPGQSAQMMADLIRAIAILAFCPGGITTFGLHWSVSARQMED